ncbi:MAG: S-formylglutathione hydrolase [Gammaproteobacteria bacterium]
MLNKIEEHKTFDGIQYVFEHASIVNQCNMRFALFLPPQAEQYAVPALYWLSGLTCTEQNFIIKSGAQRIAAKLGIALIVPDTSPPALGIPGEKESEHIGVGAGFYMDATKAPWKAHYQMYSYVTKELPQLIKDNFSVDTTRSSIAGHSMGGHGALMIALRNPNDYRSVSALAPICSVMNSSNGLNALQTYLGDHPDAWKEYDVCELIKSHPWKGPMLLVDQGTADSALANLRPEALEKACVENQTPLELRYQDGYDHGYYFVASFIEDHLRFHAKHLFSL